MVYKIGASLSDPTRHKIGHFQDTLPSRSVVSTEKLTNDAELCVKLI